MLHGLNDFMPSPSRTEIWWELIYCKLYLKEIIWKGIFFRGSLLFKLKSIRCQVQSWAQVTVCNMFFSHLPGFSRSSLGFLISTKHMLVGGLKPFLEWKLELEMIFRLNVCGWMIPYDGPIQGVFPSHAQHFQNKFLIHRILTSYWRWMNERMNK